MRKQPMKFPPQAVIGCFPTIFYVIGGVLLVGAAIILVARRKASE
jgi:LPXTG-motif cell wall-anchored protein